MLTRMKLAFNHLQHKFRQGFKGKLNPLCSCRIKADTITQHFVHCHFYTLNLPTLMYDLKVSPLSFLQLVITIIFVFFYMVMISSITQRIEKC